MTAKSVGVGISNRQMRKALARLPRKMVPEMVGMVDRLWPSVRATITSYKQGDHFVTDGECPIDQPKVPCAVCRILLLEGHRRKPTMYKVSFIYKL